MATALIPAAGALITGLSTNRSNRQAQEAARPDNQIPTYLRDFLSQVVQPGYSQIGSGSLNPRMPTTGLTAPLSPMQTQAGMMGQNYMNSPMTQGLMNSGFRGNQQLLQGMNPNQNPLLGLWGQQGGGAIAGANALLGTALSNPSLGSGTALQQPMVEALMGMLQGGRTGRGNDQQAAPTIQYVGGGTSASFNNFNRPGGGDEPTNPNLEADIAAQAAEMRRQFERTTAPAIQGQALMDGGYGGSRQGIAEGIARGDLERSINSQTAATRNVGFENRANRQLQRDLAAMSGSSGGGGGYGTGATEALAFQQQQAAQQNALEAARLVSSMLGTGYGQGIQAMETGMSPYFSALQNGTSQGFGALQNGVGMMPQTLGSGWNSMFNPAMQMGGQFQQYNQGGYDRYNQALFSNNSMGMNDMGFLAGLINGTNPGAFRAQPVGQQQSPWQTGLGAFGALSSLFGGGQQGGNNNGGGGWNGFFNTNSPNFNFGGG